MDQNENQHHTTEPSTPPAPSLDQAAPQAAHQSSGIEADKAITYLSYLGFLVIIPLLLKQDSPFVKFHARQGLVIAIGWFIGSFLYPLLGLGVLIHLALLVLSIMGLININNGEMKDLPVVGNLAKKFNI